MKTHQLITIIGASLLLGACATPPKDVASVDSKIATLTDGDFGQFIYHHAKAEEHLAHLRKVRQYWADDHYWNIDTEKCAADAEAKYAEERKLAEEALIRWHDRCDRHEEICQRLDALELMHGKPLMPLAYFDTGSAVPKSLEQKHIDALIKMAKDNPNLTVDLVGYTDTVGKAHANKHLAQHRADAVNSELAKQGLPAGTVVHEVAEGEAPGPDNTPSAENRRVDARLHHSGDGGHHHHGHHHHHHHK
jgi:outer membrane protein OmpA-like peptidoglycan-associated protein